MTISAGWREGQRGTSQNSMTVGEESCTWEGIMRCTSAGKGLICWERDLWRRTWISWWPTGWPWASSVPLWQRRSMVSWSALGRVKGWQRVFSLSAQPASAGFSAGFLGETWSSWSSEELLKCWQYWRISYMRKDWGSCASWALRRESSEGSDWCVQ